LSSSPFVSIIVPFYKNELYLKGCVSYCEKLDYPCFEIIIVANSDPIVAGDKIKWLKIDEIAQGSKKDAGAANAAGEIIAFVDDDAFPRNDWLRNAVKYFEDPTVGAVCGPGVAPFHQAILEKASSAIWDSPLGSGPARYRYVPTKMFFVDGEAPGYNLFVRCSLFLKIGGIAAKFRAGEDAILAEKIRRSGMKIVYAPDVVVYHRRRPLFMPFLQQIMTYGMHRGFFLKRFPNTSNQGDLLFTLPLFHALAFGIISIIALFGPASLQPWLRVLLALDLGIYLTSSFLSGLLVSKNVLSALIAMIGIPLTHFTFAIGYVRGFIINELGEKPSY